MVKVLYVPLDERPCNYKYPKLISEMTDDIKMLIPPSEYMGKLKNPADIEKLWNWIFENVKEAKYAILSIDTLVYGNIINSRIHHKTKDECEKYLSNIKKIKNINPDVEIHAFNLVARVANYDSSAEDPDYWEFYGSKVWEYSYLMDKINRKHANTDEEKEFEKLKNIIPADILKDFLDRRVVDRYVNLECINYVREGIIDYLVIPKDDTAEYGYAALDQSAISKKVFEYNIMDRVMVYPGADEVGCILFARVFNRIKNYMPKVYTRYSSTLGPFVVPRYEDRPLNEGIKAQITSMGGICVDTAAESDFLFAVNSPGKFMIECGDQFNNKDLTFNTYTNLHEFLRYINYYIDSFKKPCAIADVAFSNGADNEFMEYANKVGVLEKVCAYGGWNTSENTNGVCLAQACVESYYETYGWGKDKKILSEEFLIRKIVEDWLFQANTLYELAEYKEEFIDFNAYDVRNCEDKVVELMEKLLRKNINEKLGGKFLGKKIEFNSLSLPWDRIFDIDFNINLV